MPSSPDPSLDRELPAPAAGPSLAQVRIVAMACMAGPFLFAIVLLALWQQGMLPLVDADLPFVDLGAVALAAVLAMAAFVLRAQAWARARGEAPLRHRGSYMGGVILFFALLEGGILLNLVVLLLAAAPPWPNIAAAAILWLIQLAALPSESQLADGTA